MTKSEKFNNLELGNFFISPLLGYVGQFFIKDEDDPETEYVYEMVFEFDKDQNKLIFDACINNKIDFSLEDIKKLEKQVNDFAESRGGFENR
ncbi:hypothetical protein BKP35_18290 [Anaerobacillus arseniciselenatis]|uniref:Pullulanase n=1 Tax=Anaerobacillus arseniciselenatis TaxID=85682 RepID=A0A1S2L5L3_9BACI|nr:hypothetical protein [Anaerobacillus arseniciselenatis]OIJ07636.1 hypothetical protein BKP35_18290 [Anaerobacillus arseniciselenatis]